MDEKTRYVVTAKAPRGFDVKFPRHKRDYSWIEAKEAQSDLQSNGYTDVKIEENP